MMGIRDPSDVTPEYCCRLLLEYSALDSAQLFSLMKLYGELPKQKRKQMVQHIRNQQYAYVIQQEDRYYYVRRRKIAIEGRVKAQVMCFWVLLKYLNKVDRHYASGTGSSVISMEIGGRDYSIIYVEPGKEVMCSYSMEKGGVTRYFVVVDDAGQIPLIKGEHIHAFVTVSKRREVRYYTAVKGEENHVSGIDQRAAPHHPGQPGAAQKPH